MKKAFEKIRKRMKEMTEFLSDCTKYGNKDAEQQRKSYDTMHMYEIALLVEDLIEIVYEVEAEYANSASVLPWIPVAEQEEPEENGKYLVTACFYNDPDRTKTEIVSFCGEWNIGNDWNIVAWCPQRIEEYKPKDKAKDTFLSR